MSDAADVHTRREGDVVRITLHNPARRNAVSFAMWRALGDTLEALHEDPHVRVAVLTGAGDRAFSAGNDIREFDTWRDDPARHAEYDTVSARAMALLRTLPVPAIARIRGACVGGGLEIALACDLRVAADDARFAITPARLGLGYKLDDVSLVVDTAGAAAARRLLFTGQMHCAAEAAAMGLVDRVTPPHALDAAVDDLAGAIAASAPLSVRALKAAIVEAVKPPGQRDRDRVQALVDACHASEDYQEGKRAFAEKRPPVFRGR